MTWRTLNLRSCLKIVSKIFINFALINNLNFGIEKIRIGQIAK